MTLIKTSLLNGIAVLIKMATLLGLNKILAVYVGPSGYAALGQFQNAVQMITTFASGAINTGVTKYTAEYYDDEERQRAVWRTAGSIVLYASLLSAFVIITFRSFLSEWFLKGPDYSGVFLWFAVTLIFFTFNALLLAILNGKKEIRLYIVAQIIGAISSLILTSVLAMTFGLYGALVALATNQSILFFITLVICLRMEWFKLGHLFGRIDRTIVKNLFKYTFMAVTSAVCVPLSHIIIRSHLGEEFGWQAAGVWEAMWRLSAAYLMLVTTTLGVYYLPRISEVRTSRELKEEIIQGYKVILPLALVAASMVYAFRDVIVKTLFTPDFSQMRELFAWQLLGDTFKIASWILGYVMIGRAMTKTFIITEILGSVLFVVLVYVFTAAYGLKGTVIAHASNYIVYFCLMSFLISKYIHASQEEL